MKTAAVELILDRELSALDENALKDYLRRKLDLPVRLLPADSAGVDELNAIKQSLLDPYKVFVNMRRGQIAMLTELQLRDLLLSYATPAPAVNSGAVPDGWKMVPIEPTCEMKDAAFHVFAIDKPAPFADGTEVRDVIYKAMLAAAPTEPAQPTVSKSIRDEDGYSRDDEDWFFSPNDD